MKDSTSTGLFQATNDKVDDPFKYIANEFYKRCDHSIEISGILCKHCLYRYEDTVSRAEDSHSGF